MCWFFQDQANAYTRAVRDEVVEHGATMPALWRLEVLNVLALAERQRKVSATDSQRFLRFLAELDIQVVAEVAAQDQIMWYCRQYQLSAYDACYLAFAAQRGATLASQDKGLTAAARALGQPLF